MYRIYFIPETALRNSLATPSRTRLKTSKTSHISHRRLNLAHKRHISAQMHNTAAQIIKCRALFLNPLYYIILKKRNYIIYALFYNLYHRMRQCCKLRPILYCQYHLPVVVIVHYLILQNNCTIIIILFPIVAILLV